MKKVAFLAAIGTFSQGGLALAQTDTPNSPGVVSVAWEMAVPVFDLRKVQENVSFRGIAVDVHYFIQPMIALGGASSIQRFNDTFEDRTLTRNNTTVTATLYEYTSVWQLRAGAKFFPLERPPIAPYVGLQAGVAWVERITIVTDFSAQETEFSFGLTPELGVLWRLHRDNGLTASARYNFSTASIGEVDSISSISWTVGGFWGF